MNFEGNFIDQDGNKYFPKTKNMIQCGHISTSVPATSYTPYNVTFEKPFLEPPVFLACPAGNYNISCQVNNVTTTGATINVRSNDGTQRTGRWYYWIAVGKM